MVDTILIQFLYYSYINLQICNSLIRNILRTYTRQKQCYIFNAISEIILKIEKVDIFIVNIRRYSHSWIRCLKMFILHII